MDTDKRLNCKQANEMDLVAYLVSLGFTHKSPRGNNYWFLSPLHEEKTASFKVDRKLNCWYDHSLQEGGTLVDFGIKLFKCTVPEFLERLSGGSFSFQQQISPSVRPVSQDPEVRIEVTGVKDLSSPALLAYLQDRRIDPLVATQYCKQVNYSFGAKAYFAIGVANDSGGYELRSSFHKYASAPKDITTIKNGSEQVLVFEGFLDFLTYQSHLRKGPVQQFDFVILNGVGLLERARPFLEAHHKIGLMLDRDAAGQKQTAYALSLSPKYEDQSSCYKGYKDLNDWAVNCPKPPRKRLRQGLK